MAEGSRPREKKKPFSTKALLGGGWGEQLKAMSGADNSHSQNKHTFSLISRQVELADVTTVDNVGAGTNTGGVEGGPASGRHVGE